jgi:hypothetical protein
MDPVLISLVSALTALVASVIGPFVTVGVAKRQIQASVVSANRHKWISELRDMVAELVSLMTAVVVVRSRYKGPWNRGLGVLEENPELIDKVERITLVQWKIRLLLNPAEAPSLELHQRIWDTFKALQQESWDEAALMEGIESITRLTQDILKHEWQRVKAGT